jgi:hypothetical protein
MFIAHIFSQAQGAAQILYLQWLVAFKQLSGQIVELPWLKTALQSTNSWKINRASKKKQNNFAFLKNALLLTAAS